MKNVFFYFLFINIIGFLAMGIDKFKAKNNFWRTKEKTLFTIAIVGGSIGAIAGMYVFRHKTKHNFFVFGLPVILAVQIGVACYLFFRV